MRRVLAFLVSLVLVGGCALGEVLADYGDPVDLQRSDLLGTWYSGDTRLLRFEEDGTLTAIDLPHEAFGDLLPDGFDPAISRLDGTGKWTLTPPTREGLSSAVELTFRQLAGEEVAMDGPDPAVRGDDGVVRLVFYYVGSGGNSWTTYEKCLAGLPPCPTAESPTVRPT